MLNGKIPVVKTDKPEYYCSTYGMVAGAPFVGAWS